MQSIFKITASLLLAALPAAAAMGQEFRQRAPDSSGRRDTQADGSDSRRSNQFDSSGQQDQSGYGRPSSGRPDFSNKEGTPRDAGSSGLGSKPASPMAAPTMAKSSGAFTSKELPAELAILKSRSIFSRDHRAVAAATDRSTAPIFRSDVTKLVFRGAMLETDHYVAFIEETGGSRPPQWVSIGQLLTANGAQINDITLDHIVVEKSGTVRKIEVGDSLDSGTRLPSPPATASLNTTSGPAAVGSAGNANAGNAAGNSKPGTLNTSATPAVTASTTGTASDEDVADMMRRRRVQELGQ